MEVRAFLKTNNLKQRDLAYYLGVTEAAISNVVKGKSDFSKENLIKILNNPNGWDTSMLIEVKPQAPAPSQTEQVDLVIELLKAQNADLQAKVDTLNQRIGELQALLKKEREELAEIAGTSLSADAS